MEEGIGRLAHQFGSSQEVLGREGSDIRIWGQRPFCGRGRPRMDPQSNLSRTLRSESEVRGEPMDTENCRRVKKREALEEAESLKSGTD